MTHRRYRRPRTEAEKSVMAGHFGNPTAFCARCRCRRPREGGRDVELPGGRREWNCAMHAAEGA